MFNWLLILIAYLPFQIAFNPLPGVDLASGRVFILLLFGIWLIKGSPRAALLREGCPRAALMSLFLLISGLSILVAENYLWGLRKFLFFLSIFPLYFLVTSLVNNWEKIQKIVWVLVGSSGIIALIGLIQFLAQFVFGLEKVYQFWAFNIVPIFSGFNFGALILAYPSWLVEVSSQTIIRAFSLFSDPHMFSFYIGLILPLGIVLLYWTTRNNQTKFSIFQPMADQPKAGNFQFSIILAICFMLYVTCLLTFTRGAYLALVATFIILAWLFWQYLEARKAAILLCLSLLIFIIPGTPISSRFYSTFNLIEGSNIGRLEMWQQAGQLGSQHPWLGLGLGNYSLALEPGFDYRNPMTAHNLYLDIFSEMGIFALIIWLVLILGTLWQAFQRLKTRPVNPLLAGLIGSLVYFSVHSFFETPIYSPVILAILMVILGLSSWLCLKQSSISDSV